MALIIKHSGFGRRRDTKENHGKPCGSGAGKRGHEGRLETTLNAQQQMTNKLSLLSNGGRASRLQWLLKFLSSAGRRNRKGEMDLKTQQSMSIEEHTKENPQANRSQKSEPCGVRYAMPLPSRNSSAGVSSFVSFRSLEDNVSVHLFVVSPYILQTDWQRTAILLHRVLPLNTEGRSQHFLAQVCARAH